MLTEIILSQQAQAIFENEHKKILSPILDDSFELYKNMIQEKDKKALNVDIKNPISINGV